MNVIYSEVSSIFSTLIESSIPGYILVRILIFNGFPFSSTRLGSTTYSVSLFSLSLFLFIRISLMSSNTLSVANTVCLAPNLSGLQHLAIEPTLLEKVLRRLNAITTPKSNIAVLIASISTVGFSVVASSTSVILLLSTSSSNILSSTGVVASNCLRPSICSPLIRCFKSLILSGKLLFIERVEKFSGLADQISINTCP